MCKLLIIFGNIVTFLALLWSRFARHHWQCWFSTRSSEKYHQNTKKQLQKCGDSWRKRVGDDYQFGSKYCCGYHTRPRICGNDPRNGRQVSNSNIPDNELSVIEFLMFYRFSFKFNSIQFNSTFVFSKFFSSFCLGLNGIRNSVSFKFSIVEISEYLDTSDPFSSLFLLAPSQSFILLLI